MNWREEQGKASQDAMNDVTHLRASDLDAPTWQPKDRATLMFVMRPQETLLIRKLRGLGQGKINAPGGRQDPGETMLEAAIRETIEEVGVTPTNPRFRGELRFEFRDGYRLECHVFSSDGGEGEPRETPEAIPLWVPLSHIPYAEMWADDAYWLPLMLSGRTPFSGRFVFDGDKMLDHTLTSHDPASALFAKLDALSIRHDTDTHAPVFTVEQAKRVRMQHEGLHTKNLFLRNKKGTMWLVTLHEDRPVDIKALAERLGAGHLSFGSPERLRNHLGVEPGSVTPLAAMNDARGEVHVILDSALATTPTVCCHPLTNDRTTRLSGLDLVRFLEGVGHSPVILDFGRI
jgi:8-oxo-dGTP pyrophosphatase MutT (NUDIX family)